MGVRGALVLLSYPRICPPIQVYTGLSRRAHAQVQRGDRMVGVRPTRTGRDPGMSAASR